MDRVRNQSVGLEDGAYIAEMLSGFLTELGRIAREHRVTFTIERKLGLPGVLTLLQEDGDIYQLFQPAQEIARHANNLEPVRNRNIEFSVQYAKVDKKVPQAALVISGFTQKK